MSGYLVILFGVAGALFERGSPPANAPVAELLAFWATYRRELLMQSVMFVLSGAAYLWFFGALRARLSGFEGGNAATSSVAFGAGLVVVPLQLLLQVAHVAVAMGADRPIDAASAGVMANGMWALSVIAYAPMGIMLAAFSAVSFRHRAFPRWLAWLAAGLAGGHLVMTFGLIAKRGPLVPGGATTYLLYAGVLTWLAATTIVMTRRSLTAASS